MIKYQNYKHYKLPITINPLDYGKLIIKIEDLNLFIIQINVRNIALIYQYDELNHIKLYKEGDFALEYKDHKINDNIFIRNLDNKKFTFDNNKLTTIASARSIINYIDTEAIQSK
jgi:hypothetical protein